VIRLFSGLAMVVVGFLVILFSISNRTPVILDFWPLPFTLPAPLYAAVIAAGIIGFFGGGIVAWLSAGRVRRRARFASRRASGLERNLETLKSEIGELENQRKNMKAD